MKDFNSPEMNLLVFVFGRHTVTQRAGGMPRSGSGLEWARAAAHRGCCRGHRRAAGGCAGAVWWVVSSR